MNGEALGRNPLEEELDSIWNLPGKQKESEEKSDSSTDIPISAILSGVQEFDDEEEQIKAEKTVQLVGFMIADEFYGIDIMAVQEIIRIQEITMIPRSNKFIKGVVNLRGMVVPIISLRERFLIPDTEFTKKNRIIITNINVGTIGFIVDEVAEVIRLPERLIEPPPETSFSIDPEYIEGVGKMENHLIVILDLNKVLTSGK